MLFFDVVAGPTLYPAVILGIIFLVIALLILGAGIFLLVKYLRKKKEQE